MLVAGVDVGNSTTEVALARAEPGADPEWLLVLRRETTGPKGSVACAEGVADLLSRAERRLGERARLLLLADLHPVEASLVELGRLEELELARAAIARPASSTPSGFGVAAGILRPLQELERAPDHRQPTIPVVLAQDFELAARSLVAARKRGWVIPGVVVEADDAVLIGNRFDPKVPIVDEVGDAADLPPGAVAALEVAPPGGDVQELADPLRIAVLLGLTPEEARAARHAARAVAGHRAAIVVRDDRAVGAGQARPARDAPAITLLDGEGHECPLDEQADPPPPGAITAIRGPAGDRDGLLDVFWRPLPAPPEDAAFSRRLARRRAIAVATLSAGSADGLLAALEPLAPDGVDVVARESEAAVYGASTTPGAGTAPFVLDLGGGTVDLHRDADGGERMMAVAGAGDLVTGICAALLGCDRPTGERAKRSPSARVETPFILHHEDGSRSFLGEPASPETVSRLCVLAGRRLQPLAAPLAPEVWRGLRRAAKREVVGRNVERALAAAGDVPRGELVTLVGGSACDAEIVGAVAAQLAPRDVAVARGDVLGRHGPRAAVAVGLVLAHVRRGRR